MADVKGIMEAIPRHFLPEKAQGVNAVVNYVLTGEGGGDWTMKFRDGTCEVASGRSPDAKVTITMDANDYCELTTGKLDAIKAFMSGKIRVGGDFGLASRIGSFFRID